MEEKEKEIRVPSMYFPGIPTPVGNILQGKKGGGNKEGREGGKETRSVSETS